MGTTITEPIILTETPRPGSSRADDRKVAGGEVACQLAFQGHPRRNTATPIPTDDHDHVAIRAL